MHSMFYLLVTFFFLVSEVLTLKLTEVSIPAVVIKGQSVRLGCYFELEEADKLYSVKWHKDSVEFYRYLPENRPNPAQKYHLEGTTSLDVKKSNKDYVFLSKTDVQSEGIYRCEVSTDAPKFQTVKGEGEMRIYVFPEEKPSIEGAKESYVSGEEVRVTCKAAPSRPATFLRWYINGKEAPLGYLMRRDPDELDDGLMVSNLGLRFTVRNDHFVDDASITLYCEAVIYQAHTLISEEILVYQNTSSKIKNDYDQTPSGFDNDKKPTISGGSIPYRVDSEVDVNCTAPRSLPPAELHWYINEKEVRSEHLVKYPNIRYTDGLESSVLGLKFKLKQRYFPKGGQPMRLRCTAAALSERTRMSSPVLQVLNRNQRQQVSGLHIYEKSLAVSNSVLKNPDLNPTWTLLAVILSAIFTF